MRARWKDCPDPVPRGDDAALQHDCHHPGLETRSCRSAEQRTLQAGLEAIDQDAGRAQACKLDGRRVAQPEHSPKRKAFKVESDSKLRD